MISLIAGVLVLSMATDGKLIVNTNHLPGCAKGRTNLVIVVNFY